MATHCAPAKARARCLLEENYKKVSKNNYYKEWHSYLNLFQSCDYNNSIRFCVSQMQSISVSLWKKVINWFSFDTVLLTLINNFAYFLWYSVTVKWSGLHAKKSYRRRIKLILYAPWLFI